LPVLLQEQRRRHEPRAPALACPQAGPAQVRYDRGPAEA